MVQEFDFYLTSGLFIFIMVCTNHENFTPQKFPAIYSNYYYDGINEPCCLYIL